MQILLVLPCSMQAPLGTKILTVEAQTLHTAAPEAVWLACTHLHHTHALQAEAPPLRAKLLRAMRKLPTLRGRQTPSTTRSSRALELGTSE